MSEFRYVIRRSGSGTVDLIDTLKSHYMFVGIDNIDAMGLKRSDLEDLKKQIDKVLKKP